MDDLYATEAKLSCLKMVEGTDLHWRAVVRFRDTKRPIHRELMDYEGDSLEFAVGLVEGKPVWGGKS